MNERAAFFFISTVHSANQSEHSLIHKHMG